ncbi:MAG: hypothetical protein ACJ735_04385 [Actinomycetes bacterium]
MTPPRRFSAALIALVAIGTVIADVAVISTSGNAGHGSSREGSTLTLVHPGRSSHSPRAHAPGRPSPAAPGTSQPQPSGPSSSGSPSTAPKRTALTDLLAGRVGFGRASVGGAGGGVVVVNNSADSGPGTLRAALATPGPRWIVFDRDMTINTLSSLRVPSYITVDGRGHHVLITGHNHYGFELINDRDVIIENVAMRDFGLVQTSGKNDLNNEPDAIFTHNAHNVWIDHCDLSMAGDKLIQVDYGTTAVSVTWSHFHNQAQVFQIGDQKNAQVDEVQTVTVADNFFDHTGYRNPVLSYGRAHVYNNYFLDWQVFAVRSQRGAQMYLERNVFVAGSNTRASLVKPDGNGCNDNHTRCDSTLGYINAVGNLLEHGAKLNVNEPSWVFRPSAYYTYRAQPASMHLAQVIQAEAGVR